MYRSGSFVWPQTCRAGWGTGGSRSFVAQGHPEVPSHSPCSAVQNWTTALFFLWVFFFFFLHRFVFFLLHVFRIVPCSNQPSQHNSISIPIPLVPFWMFFGSPKPDFLHTRKLPRWALEILVMKYLGCLSTVTKLPSSFISTAVHSRLLPSSPGLSKQCFPGWEPHVAQYQPWGKLCLCDSFYWMFVKWVFAHMRKYPAGWL